MQIVVILGLAYFLYEGALHIIGDNPNVAFTHIYLGAFIALNAIIFAISFVSTVWWAVDEGIVHENREYTNDEVAGLHALWSSSTMVSDFFLFFFPGYMVVRMLQIDYTTLITIPDDSQIVFSLTNNLHFFVLAAFIAILVGIFRRASSGWYQKVKGG